MITPTPERAAQPQSRGEHTAGPWKIAYDDGSAAASAQPEVIIETDDRHIAFCFGAGETNDVQAVADYRLIAAAPELLAACKALLQHGWKGADDARLCLLACKGTALDDGDLAYAEQFGQAAAMARAAIAKAEETK